MIVKFLRFLSGTIRFSAENGSHERLLTACAKEGISLFDVKATETGFCAQCLLFEFPDVKKFAERFGVSIKDVKERGTMRHLRKHKLRFFLPLGIAIVIGLLFFSQAFLWTVDVTGNKTVSAAAVQRVLEEEGLNKMCYLPSCDFRLIREKALLKLPQLSFMTINRYGSRLEVIVAERTVHDPVRSDEPCDVVSKYDAVIRSMDVYEGKETTGVGYTVTEGEILVHGHYQTKKGDILLVHADAKVIAEVRFSKTISIDLQDLRKEYMGEQQTALYTYLFDLKIPLSFIGRPDETYEETVERTAATLFDKEFPFGLEQHTYRTYRLTDEKTARKNAEEKLRRAFSQYEAQMLSDHAILSRHEEFIKQGTTLYLKTDYVTECDIAVQKEVTLQEFTDPSEIS